MNALDVRTPYETKQDVARLNFDRKQLKGAIKNLKKERDKVENLFKSYMANKQNQDLRSQYLLVDERLKGHAKRLKRRAKCLSKDIESIKAEKENISSKRAEKAGRIIEKSESGAKRALSVLREEIARSKRIRQSLDIIPSTG